MSSHPGTSPARLRTRFFAKAKAKGAPFSCLTSYDCMTAAVFDEAGIDLLLVGDSLANVVLGRETTLSLTMEEMIPLTRAVVEATSRSFVVVDLPFGSYEESPAQALRSAVRMLKETGAQAVKIEGGKEIAPTISALVAAGIPVCAHIGFTPQSVHALGGFVVQGRGEAAGRLLADAQAVATAGAFAVVLEMVPAELAAQVTKEVSIPTIGIGAGNACDGQILVWTDAFGMGAGKTPRFVRQYADLRTVLSDAARAYAADVAERKFPNEAESFSDSVKEG
ncbi:TPA: 3-methyl-2-oxobutanoate hydroxymethyltransferase [Corynebacterium striatum]|uniref:3-methyl-2-oxobutanoate hydroxymethyltransferase n=1 Tax=Corynebacterium striatum TaxID=43770 RepID=UPI001A1C8FF7|nr:3-methyl-2-oxobutanoate hydroxymethyltransferase [Corynebacterium striatum]HAT1242651.1 3-methyl-2-oxobutanoate hydroxymethyltransferase [Corynebacterium striatum]HAT1250539.1 3-methyl-2-oxobutanoate hydroxymethyltransferase [Corynebacterium striatum]HAT1253396.1 3-methyl-2-oxobutanoate hydroxymethyltransferase [Corynebacterium striatum]HAT1266157.1 3-methyl-2-oxobutanoate hydroxymethyltransferase [Corynebacterium striatum]